MFLIFLFTGLISISAQADDKLQLIESIVDIFRPEAESRFGKEISLKIHADNPMLQASAGRLTNGDLEVTVYGGIINQFNGAEIVFVLCHELGHIFGTTFGDRVSAVEGEADYFAGSCVADVISQLNLNDDPEESIKNTLEKLYQSPIDYTLAMRRSYHGINLSYPDRECRLFSALSGLKDEPRPKCWFNPDL